MINDELQSKRFRWIQPRSNEDERSRADQGAKNFTTLKSWLSRINLPVYYADQKITLPDREKINLESLEDTQVG